MHVGGGSCSHPQGNVPILETNENRCQEIGPKVLDSVTFSLCGRPRPAHLLCLFQGPPPPCLCSIPRPPLTGKNLLLVFIFPTRNGVLSHHVGSPAWGQRTVGVACVEGGSRWGRQGSGSCLPRPSGRVRTQSRTKAAGKQAGGGGRAVGRPQGAPAPATGGLSPCQGPVGLTQASGLGRGGSGRGGPHGSLHPVTQPRLGLPREDSGGLWVPGGPPGRCEPRGALGPGRAFLSLSFFICTMGLISQSWGPDSQTWIQRVTFGTKRGASDSPSCLGGQMQGRSQVPL